MRRVVVTGIGLLTPVGNTKEESWSALLEGKSGVAITTGYDPEVYKTKISGEVKNFNPEDHHISAKAAKRMDPFEQFALAASYEAMIDSGLDKYDYDPTKAGTSIGVGFGGIHTFEKQHTPLAKDPQKAPRRISPFMIPMLIANMGSGIVSIEFNLKGPQFSPVAACASGTYGVIEGFRAIKEGIADIMVSGGAESAVSPMGTGGFMTMKALSTRNDEPEKASRPFDKDRDGFVPGEGAGILVLEELEHAKKRGAKIYAEITGYGSTSDAFHITQPAPEGEGAFRAMKMALEIANAKPEEIDYINAHGTSTYFNDLNETKAIKNLLGKHAYEIKVNSTKSMTGHLLGAAGGVEAVVTALSIYHGKVHPTINRETPDPECDLDYVVNGAENLEIKKALSNSFGFGGVNGVLLMEKYEGD